MIKINLKRICSLTTGNFPPKFKANFGTDMLNKTMETENRCWKCGCSTNKHSFFCTNCGKVQRVSIHKQLNLYDIFGIKSEFHIDLKELEKSFKSIQLNLHPDKFATCTLTEQDASLSSSSSVNQAYQVYINLYTDFE
jgi:hypothetical protein